MCKIKKIIIAVICFAIISCGIIKVNNEVISMSKFIRNTSGFKIDFSLKPFNFTLDTNKYIFYINDRAFINIKNNIWYTLQDIKNLHVKFDAGKLH